MRLLKKYLTRTCLLLGFMLLCIANQSFASYCPGCENSSLSTTISGERGIHDFTIVSYASGFTVSTNADWVNFYQNSFTTTRGSRTALKVCYESKANTGSSARTANITVSFTDPYPGYDLGAVSFTITQDYNHEAHPIIEQAPSIIVGKNTYTNPQMVNGVVTINYDRITFIDSVQEIVLLTRNLYSHKATEIKKSPNASYLMIKEPPQSGTCTTDYHPFKAWFINYPAPLTHDKWNVIPELKIEVRGEGYHYQNFSTITYIIRFTNIIVQPGSVDDRGYPANAGRTTPRETYDKTPEKYGMVRCPVCSMWFENDAAMKEHYKSHTLYGSNWDPKTD